MHVGGVDDVLDSWEHCCWISPWWLSAWTKIWECTHVMGLSSWAGQGTRMGVYNHYTLLQWQYYIIVVLQSMFCLTWPYIDRFFHNCVDSSLTIDPSPCLFASLGSVGREYGDCVLLEGVSDIHSANWPIGGIADCIIGIILVVSWSI